VIALVALALASERPVLDEAGDALCPPKAVAAAAPAPCAGVLVSLARAKWYAAMVVWADEQRDLRELEAVTARVTLEAAEERGAWWRARAEAPPVATLPPAAWFAVGVGAGAVAVLGGAVAVRWATEVSVTDHP
jgi:hypothetical protein